MIKIPLAGHKKQFLLVLAIVAGVFFNNWLLGPILNPHLFSNNGSVSEFSAGGQPYAWIFRALDVLSGLLMVVLALVARRVMVRAKISSWLAGTALVLGLANAVDALFVISCSNTVSPNCNIPINLSPSHFQLPSHAYSSIIIGVCYLLLPALGFWYAHRQKSMLLKMASAVAVLVAVASGTSAFTQYVVNSSLSVKTSGGGQEFQMMILALWFIAWGWTLSKKDTSI